MSTGVNNQSQALNVLKQNGVDGNFLNKVQGYLNNPMAGMIAKVAGVDLNNVKNAVNALQGVNPSRGTNTPANNITLLRQGLQQLKR